MDRLEPERMFVAVMETGSFTAAAERLGTSSGQASKLVTRLENELGVRLLSRTTRAVSPLTLAPGQNNLEITYTALSYINSDQLRFKYKLAIPSATLKNRSF